MKVKIIAHHATDILTEKVNEFLQGLTPQQVVNIQYACCNDFSEVMIVYNE